MYEATYWGAYTILRDVSWVHTCWLLRDIQQIYCSAQTGQHEPCNILTDPGSNFHFLDNADLGCNIIVLPFFLHMLYTSKIYCTHKSFLKTRHCEYKFIDTLQCTQTCYEYVTVILQCIIPQTVVKMRWPYSLPVCGIYTCGRHIKQSVRGVPTTIEQHTYTTFLLYNCDTLTPCCKCCSLSLLSLHTVLVVHVVAKYIYCCGSPSGMNR